MRSIVFSAYARTQLRDLLVSGLEHYSRDLIHEKRLLVKAALKVLAHFPDASPHDPTIGLCRHVISDTPFVVFYSFDDHRLTVELVLHRRADRGPWAMPEFAE